MLKKIIPIYLILLFLNPQIINAILANTVVATIPVGINPAGIAITADSKIAYVANSNGYPTTPNEHTVSVLNLTNNLVSKTIRDNSFNEPYTVTINPSGTLAYVTNSNGYTVTIIEIATNTVVGIISGFDGPSGMVITPDGLFGYVNNYGAPPPGVGSGNGHTISVVDLKTNVIIDTLEIGLAPAALAITPDGKFIYVIDYVDGNIGTGTLNRIQTNDNAVTLNIVTGFSGPFGIAITPDNKFAYITNFGSNNFTPIGTTVSVVNLSSNSVISTINLGIQPAGIAITPDGRFAYATNYNTLYADFDDMHHFINLTPGQGTVNIIDIATNTVLPPVIAVGESPHGVYISPNGEFAYVSNYTYNSVDVIALQSFNITATGCKVKNKFLTQTDRINKLNWTVTGTSKPVSYKIYRNANLTDLAGTVQFEQSHEFLDHNRKSNTKDTYYIVGINRVGTESTPVVVTI